MKSFSNSARSITHANYSKHHNHWATTKLIMGKGYSVRLELKMSIGWISYIARAYSSWPEEQNQTCMWQSYMYTAVEDTTHANNGNTYPLKKFLKTCVILIGSQTRVRWHNYLEHTTHDIFRFRLMFVSFSDIFRSSMYCCSMVRSAEQRGHSIEIYHWVYFTNKAWVLTIDG